MFYLIIRYNERMKRSFVSRNLIDFLYVCLKDLLLLYVSIRLHGGLDSLKR